MSSYHVEGVDPFGEDVTLDKGIMDALPSGCRVTSTSRAGQSLWVETVRIEVELPDGTEKVYFKKGAAGEIGQAMMHGAFESEQTVHSFIPEYVPQPVAYGTYVSQPNIHFYLADYVEMEERHPDAEAWATVVSSLHRRSMGKSPNKQFGFHMSGHLANVPVNNTWNSSWETFWSQQLKSMCEEEERRCGYDEAFSEVKKLFFNFVIPRYLRPLESNGRSVQPCLLHNDLWPGNIKPRSDAPGTLCLFDSACYWGHNEADVRITRANVWNLEKAGEIYRELVGVSEPQDDYAARIEVYAVCGLVLRSAMYSQEPKRRTMCIEGMQQLVDRVLIAPTLNKVIAPTMHQPDEKFQKEAALVVITERGQVW